MYIFMMILQMINDIKGQNLVKFIDLTFIIT